MLKMVLTWFGWFDTGPETPKQAYPVKTIDDVIKMIEARISFKAVVDKKVFQQLQAYRMPSMLGSNLMSSHYHKGVYYDARRNVLSDTNYPDSIVHDEIIIISNKEGK